MFTSHQLSREMYDSRGRTVIYPRKLGHGLLTAVVWLMFFYCSKDLELSQ